MPTIKTIKVSDIRIPLDYSLCEQGCTQSLACSFKQCPRKFLFKINRWRSRKGQEKSAVGNIVHAGLATIYPEINNSIYEIIKNEINVNSKKYSFLSSEQIESYKTISYCLLLNYLKVYKKDFDNAYFDKTEEEFAVKLPGGVVLWRGKRDGIHTVKKDNSLWVREIKTRGRINEENMLAGLQFDFQGNLYVLTNDIDTKENTAGFIYDMIRTPQIKQKKDETLHEYSDRLMKDIESRSGFYFMRFQVPLAIKDKASFSSELFHLEKELIFYVNTSDISYKNSFSCIDGYITCEYLDACTTGVMTDYYQSDKIFEELDCGY